MLQAASHGEDESLEDFFIPTLRVGLWLGLDSMGSAGGKSGLQSACHALAPLPALLNYGKSFKLLH